MEVLLVLYGIGIITWATVVTTIEWRTRRKEEKEFADRIRRLSYTACDTNDHGAVVRYDIGIDFPSNIIEINGKGSC